MGWLGLDMARDCLDPEPERTWPFWLLEFVRFIVEPGGGIPVFIPMLPSVCACTVGGQLPCDDATERNRASLAKAEGWAWAGYLSWSANAP